MRIYIATPINGRNERSFEDKYREAEKRVDALRNVLRTDPRFWSHSFVSSIEINAPGSQTEAMAMGKCIAAVLECDAVYLDHGWQDSKGCNAEYQTAKIYGKKIIEHDKLNNYEG